MDAAQLTKFVQTHFTDGLVVVIGSGLSAAEGIPGMVAVANHLDACATSLTGEDANLWNHIRPMLAIDGLEAALLKHPPSSALESWIVRRVAEFLVPREREVIDLVIRGSRVLRLSKLLSRVILSSSGLPILTPNYDRLIEVACEMVGLHVDTTAIGNYAGSFDHMRSCMGSCRGIVSRAKFTVLDHYPRAIVLKPHGSFDWYQVGTVTRRCSIELDADRLIITPGLNKYRAGYNAPFDKHRELANDHIKRSARLLVIGYGFNDDHLQTHLIKRIRDGTPTLILSRSLGEHVIELARNSPNCVCLSKAAAGGTRVITRNFDFDLAKPDFWDIGVLAEELLG